MLWLATVIACNTDIEVNAEAPATPEVAPEAAPAAAPAAAPTVALQETPEGPAGESPQGTLVIQAGGQTYTVGPYQGQCTEAEKAEGDVASYRCWWAGSGANLHVKQAANGLEVWKQDVAEEIPGELPTQLVWTQSGGAQTPK
jgi:hypothetical protein